VVLEPDAPEPWVVQADDRRPDTWSDLARFHEAADARRFVQQVRARHQSDEAKRRKRLGQ